MEEPIADQVVKLLSQLLGIEVNGGSGGIQENPHATVRNQDTFEVPRQSYQYMSGEPKIPAFVQMEKKSDAAGRAPYSANETGSANEADLVGPLDATRLRALSLPTSRTGGMGEDSSLSTGSPAVKHQEYGSSERAAFGKKSAQGLAALKDDLGEVEVPKSEGVHNLTALRNGLREQLQGRYGAHNLTALNNGLLDETLLGAQVAKGIGEVVKSKK
jgi:hypothetical protein